MSSVNNTLAVGHRGSGTNLSRSEKLSLIIEAWLLLLKFDLIKGFRSSEFLRMCVGRQKVHLRDKSATLSTADLTHAMDLACIFYFKRVLCLQQSSATTIQMRRHGWSAHLITGAQTMTCDFHAWVEVDGTVINDRPYMREIYRVWEMY